jgi:hypothetical protein
MIKQPDPLTEHDRDEVDHHLIDQTGLKALLIDAGA